MSKHKDDIATAKFAIRSVLIQQSFYFANPVNIEYLVDKLFNMITESNCSHAFKKILEFRWKINVSNVIIANSSSIRFTIRYGNLFSFYGHIDSEKV